MSRIRYTNWNNDAVVIVAPNYSWEASDDDQARANPIENFRLVFNDVFIKSIVGRMDDNEDIFKKIVGEPAFQAAVMDHYLRRVFEQARLASPE